MKAGRELDVKMAGLMGCYAKQDFTGTWDLIIPNGVNQINFVNKNDVWSGVPAYSTDISAAWPIAEKLRLFVLPWGEHEWCATPKRDATLAFREFSASATAPLAICLAALKVMEDENESR